MIYFLIGIIFYMAFQPIMESFVELIQVMLEAVKAKYAIKVSKMNKEVRELQEPKDEVTHVIGFQMPDTEEELEEDGDF